jgi:hypothetical protein
MSSDELSRLEARVAELERENQRLWRTNQQLARDRLGIADSAAAATIERIRAGGGSAHAAPTAIARLGGRIRRAFVLALPHGVVLMRMRLRSARNPDES